MFVDTITIIICFVLLSLSLLSIFANPFFRKIKVSKNNDIDCNNLHVPSISVLIIAHDDPDSLQNTLSAVIGQDYSQDFEIIVVIDQGDVIAENIIKTCAQERKIYTTFVPRKSLFMSKEKLAVSLAVKAAHNEWIALLKSGCVPQSTKWLTTMSRNCNEEISIITGYCNYNLDAPGYYRFEQLRTSLYLIRKAQFKTAYRANGYNILFRKSVFINEDGYRGNLEFRHGVCDFLVNKYAQKGNTVAEISKVACVREGFTQKTWYNKNIHSIHIRKHFLRRLSFKFLYDIDLFLMYLNYAIIFSTIIYASLTLNMILMSVSLILLIMTIVLRVIIARNAIIRFGETMSVWKIIPYEFALLICNMILRLKYQKSDKRDYTTHKI